MLFNNLFGNFESCSYFRNCVLVILGNIIHEYNICLDIKLRQCIRHSVCKLRVNLGYTMRCLLIDWWIIIWWEFHGCCRTTFKAAIQCLSLMQVIKFMVMLQVLAAECPLSLFQRSLALWCCLFHYELSPWVGTNCLWTNVVMCSLFGFFIQASSSTLWTWFDNSVLIRCGRVYEKTWSHITPPSPRSFSKICDLKSLRGRSMGAIKVQFIGCERRGAWWLISVWCIALEVAPTPPICASIIVYTIQYGVYFSPILFFTLYICYIVHPKYSEHAILLPWLEMLSNKPNLPNFEEFLFQVTRF